MSAQNQSTSASSVGVNLILARHSIAAVHFVIVNLGPQNFEAVNQSRVLTGESESFGGLSDKIRIGASDHSSLCLRQRAALLSDQSRKSL